jgi:diguanylate cyclase (GGDEF)-like protein
MQDISGPIGKRLHLTQVWPLVAVAILGLAVAAAAWITVSVWEERLAKARFNDVAGDYQAALQTGVDHYVDEIAAVRSFFDASDSVNFHEFDLFTGRILSGRDAQRGFAQAPHSHDPIVKIMWSPLVTGSERAAFERAQRAEGRKDFSISRWTLAGPIKPELPRAEYFPVLYSTSHLTDRGLEGMDLNSEPVRRDTIRRAIATGRMAIAQDVILRAPHGEDVRGFFVAQPVYKHGTPLGVKARPQDFRGILSGTFQTAALMDKILDESSLPATVGVYLFAANAGEKSSPLFSRGASGRADKEDVLKEPHWSAPLSVGESRWELFIVPLKGALIGYYRTWLVVGVVGLIFAAVLAYMWSSLRHTLRLETANRRILQLAQTDILTSLANRRAFMKRLKIAFAASLRGAPPFAVLYLDVDDFKDVNDTLGHAMGDELLKGLVVRLKTVVRDGDLVARFGGDEFAILASNINDPTEAGTLAARIAKALADPFLIDAHKLTVTSSIGIAQFSRDIAGPEAMMVQADLALYGAKDEGRNCYRFHSEDLDLQVHERVRIADELRTALEEGELELYYQPQVELATGRVTGAEALVRWNHKTRGLLTPGTFIAIAERTGAIQPLGNWIFDEACRQMKAWQDEGVAPEVLAVNVSGVQLKSAELEREVEASIAKWDINPGEIELELTESVLMEATQRHNVTLETLRNMGMRIAIDDFGTGYSSLKYLTTYPVNRLKLAQEFVFRVTVDYRNAAVVRAAIRLAHELGIDVIAEGVETEAQMRFLIGAGCEQAQGYFFSRPVPAAQMTDLLRAGRIEPAPAPQQARYTSAA